MSFIDVITSSRRPNFSDLVAEGCLIGQDWHQNSLSAKVKFLFWLDEEHLHFLAEDQHGPGISHPQSDPGGYHADLWQYDVAEFFLLAADGQSYLEFNLAPNGSWWSCKFSSPRTMSPGEPTPLPEVLTLSKQNHSLWRTHARIPRAFLETEYGLGNGSRLNANFILGAPDRIFLTAGTPGEAEPDYHRPDLFPEVKLRKV